MHRHGKKAKTTRKVLPVWTFSQVKEALPYLASVVTSVREHRIEALAHDRQARRLADRPGRPDRDAIIAHENTARAARAAGDRFREAVEELQGLGIYPLDPVRGEALIPFVHADQLAWFVYDLFDPDHLSFWRYHNDALDKRRPIAEVEEEGSADPPLVA